MMHHQYLYKPGIRQNRRDAPQYNRIQRTSVNVQGQIKLTVILKILLRRKLFVGYIGP